MNELKWTMKKEGKEIGVLELSNPQIFSFDILDGKCRELSISLEITELSEEFRRELDKFIEERKQKAVLKNIRCGKRFNQERCTAWSDTPVKFQYIGFSIDLYKDQENKSEIIFSVCDGIFGIYTRTKEYFESAVIGKF